MPIVARPAAATGAGWRSWKSLLAVALAALFALLAFAGWPASAQAAACGPGSAVLPSVRQSPPPARASAGLRTGPVATPSVLTGRFVAEWLGARAGTGIVRLYGDLKRHDMGPGLAEQIDELKDPKSGPSIWLTENLWGVGSTAPYLHDGRATTLTEAILEHGGESQAAHDAFVALSAADKKDVITFLNNQIIFRVEDNLAALAAAIQ